MTRPTPELWERCRRCEPMTDEELLCLYRDTVETLASIEARGVRFSLVTGELARERDTLAGFAQARGLDVGG